MNLREPMQHVSLMSPEGPVIPVRAVVVGVEGQPAEQLIAAIRAKGIHAYARGSDVLDRVRKDPWHTMIIARLLGLKRPEIEALRKMVYDNPALKFVAVAGVTHGKELAALRQVGLQRVLEEPFDVTAVANAAAEEIAQHHFDPRVVEWLRSSMPRLLADAPVKLSPAIVQLRVTSQVLARMSAIVEISGADLVGRLMVSGEPVVLTRLARYWLGEDPHTKDGVWDAVAELANRVASEVRAHYLHRGLSSVQSAPIVIEGSDTEIRHTSKKPSLVFPFQVERSASEVHIEWHLAHKSPLEVVTAVDSPSLVDADGLAFF